MSSSSDQSAIAALIATGRVKFISFLVVIALLLGIFSEVITVAINLYTWRKLRCDMVSSMFKVASETMSGHEIGDPKFYWLHNWQKYREICLEK